MLRFSIQLALLLLVVLYAWKRGGRVEKNVALVLLGMQAANIGHAFFAGQWTQYDAIPVFRALLDLAGFILILLIALTANRWWTLWLSAIQFQAVLAHLLKALNFPLPPLIYAIMERWPFWIAIALTGVGTLLYDRKHKRRQAS